MRLIGYCLEDEHRLLVYEFLPRGSLENHLFRSEFSSPHLLSKGAPLFGSVNLFILLQLFLSGGLYFQPLSWSLRLKIALGAAKGLAFLHSDENKVIYRDFKTSNILLDSVSSCYGVVGFQFLAVFLKCPFYDMVAELQCKAL